MHNWLLNKINTTCVIIYLVVLDVPHSYHNWDFEGFFLNMTKKTLSAFAPKKANVFSALKMENSTINLQQTLLTKVSNIFLK